MPKCPPFAESANNKYINVISFINGGKKMAGIPIEKLKNGAQIKSKIKHNTHDPHVTHANKNINPELTPYNIIINNNNYISHTDAKDIDKVYNTVQRIIKAEDAIHPPKRVRKDRVVATQAIIYVPADIPPDKTRQWCLDAINAYNAAMGGITLGGWVHVDEIHDYLAKDSNQRTSMRHMHVLSIAKTPDRGINGKNFVNRQKYYDVNKAIDDMCRDKYNCKYNLYDTVEERKQHTTDKSVEILKMASSQALTRQIEKQKQILAEREAEIDNITAKEIDAQERYNRLIAISAEVENCYCEIEAEYAKYKAEATKLYNILSIQQKIDIQNKETDVADMIDAYKNLKLQLSQLTDKAQNSHNISRDKAR